MKYQIQQIITINSFKPRKKKKKQQHSVQFSYGIRWIVYIEQYAARHKCIINMVFTFIFISIFILFGNITI